MTYREPFRVFLRFKFYRSADNWRKSAIMDGFDRSTLRAALDRINLSDDDSHKLIVALDFGTTYSGYDQKLTKSTVYTYR